MTRSFIILSLASWSTLAAASSTSLSGTSLTAQAKDPSKAQKACRTAYIEGVTDCRAAYPDGGMDLDICLEGVAIAYRACMLATADTQVARMAVSDDGATLSLSDDSGTAETVDLYRTGKDGRDRFIGTADVDEDGTVQVGISTAAARRIKNGSEVITVWFAGEDVLYEDVIEVRR
jgi:hypothetical protein